MKTTSVSGAALAAVSIFSSFAAAVQPLTVDGANFITKSSGNRFSIVGVDYQPGGSSGVTATSDPLSDPQACLRDAILLQRLGVNTIRVYNLIADINHDECASIFNAAGIYMILDVNNGFDNSYLDRSAPWTTYTNAYLTHVFSIIEAFAPYPNLLGFFSGNEVINQDSAVNAPAYIRAVTRDMKDYIAKNVARDIGVGYSAADVANLLSDTWEYLGCDLANSTSSKIDFFGLNDYEWCGDSSYMQSGYNVLVQQFGNTSIPVFFSEYGCNKVEPRTFTNVPVLYGDQMSVLSGGLVYEYSEDTNNYGLVNITTADEIHLLQDYGFLATQYAKLDENLLTSANSTATGQKPPTCDPSLITGAGFYNSWDLPPRPSGVDALISSGLSSANKGKTVSVTSTAMPATVYDYDGSQLNGLELTVLEEQDSNRPGLAGNYTPSTPTGTAAATSGSTGGSSSATRSSSGKASSTASQTAATSKGAAAPMFVSSGAATFGALLASLFLFKECQVVDLPVHRTICKSFAQFKTKPSPAVFRAIYFPVDRPNPEFVWMKMDEHYAYTQPDLAAMRKSFLGDSKDCLWPIHLEADHVRMMKIYPHIILGCSLKVPSLDDPVNQSITTLIGKEVHGVRGSFIAYGQIKQEDEDGKKYPIVTDLDTTDLTIITNYFLGRHRHDEAEMDAVRIYSNRNSRPGHHFNANTIRSTKELCHGDLGLFSPISIFFGMPLAVLYRLPLGDRQPDTPKIREAIEKLRAELPPDSGNRLASLLMIDMGNRKGAVAQDFGTIPAKYLDQLGDAIVVRKDQKPLDPAYLEAFCTWIEEDLLPKFADAHEQIMYSLATEYEEDSQEAREQGIALLKLRDKMYDRCSRKRFRAWCKENGLHLRAL
ncbi:beta-glucanosyltransferase gel2, partial [Aureobasidium melanogenum]